MQAAQRAITSPLLEDGSVSGARGVIINVTGGPDLSLLEVNEASCVIQEAAHEDANIIFGAVVDPALTGKIKITVIATGFDRTSSPRGTSVGALQTPVDLSNYTEHLARAESAEEPAVDGVSKPIDTRVPTLTVTRRPALDLGVPKTSSVRKSGLADHEFDPNVASPLDVPAFLRRQS
jgi:cell division protein FtsZ